MIPVADSVRTRRTPWINLSLILACVLVFLYELSLGPRLDAFVQRWGATPIVIERALAHGLSANPAYWTLLTSQFIHAGWGHLLGNMLFLWVFGRAVEDRLGHLLYLILYLVWGAGAALAQVMLTGPVREPLVGASGAISGVLGAYIVMFPGASVSLLVPIFFFFWIINVPALLVLGFWFLTQLFNGAAAITRASNVTGGVAFWAHVGGFVLGIGCALVVPRRSRSEEDPRLAARRHRRRGVLWTLASIFSSLAHILALLVVARVLLLLGGAPVAGIESVLARLLLDITAPLVEPFADMLPVILVNGRMVELFSVAAAIVYWATGAVLAWALESSSGRAASES